jgi:hypothetical protein
MLQPDLSMALAAMHIRELVAESERHTLLKAARRDAATTPWSTRVKNVATRILAWFRTPREESVRAAGTCMTGSGPIGCSA